MSLIDTLTDDDVILFASAFRRIAAGDAKSATEKERYAVGKLLQLAKDGNNEPQK